MNIKYIHATFPVRNGNVAFFILSAIFTETYDILMVKEGFSMRKIVLFDGDCHFCNKSVQFILKRDPHKQFLFTSQQSEIGRELLREVSAPMNLDSLILIEGNRYFDKSSAALKICRYLRGAWKVFYVLLIVPKPLRDIVYHLVAKNRYRWFGEQNHCPIPSLEDRERFL